MMFLNNRFFYIKSSINNFQTNKIPNLYKVISKITLSTISIYNNNNNNNNNSNNNNNCYNNSNKFNSKINVKTAQIVQIVKQLDFIENFQKKKE